MKITNLVPLNNMIYLIYFSTLVDGICNRKTKVVDDLLFHKLLAYSSLQWTLDADTQDGHWWMLSHLIAWTSLGHSFSAYKEKIVLEEWQCCHGQMIKHS